MAANIAGVQALLNQCSIVANNAVNMFVNIEGIQHLEDFALIASDKVEELAKWMASHPGQAHVILGSIQLGRLKGLLFWVCDCLHHQLAVDVNIFNDNTLTVAIEAEHVLKVKKEVAKATTIEVEDFKGSSNWILAMHSFKNHLKCEYSANKMPLDYVIREPLALGMNIDAMSKDRQQKYQVQLAGAAYNLDNKHVFM